MRFRSFLPLLALAAVSIAPAASAAPITFTFQGTASGSFGQTPFADVPFTFLMTGDTVNNVELGSGVLGTDVTGTITILGFQTATITQTLFIFNNQNFAVGGLARGSTATPGDDLLDISSAAFAGWNMDTSIGPFVESPPIFADVTALSTSGGSLTFSSVPSASFEAVVSGGAAPEPTSALLCLAGVGLIAIARRRR